MKNDKLCVDKLKGGALNFKRVAVMLGLYVFPTKQDRDANMKSFDFSCEIQVKDTEQYVSDFTVNGEDLLRNWSESPPHLCFHVKKDIDSEDSDTDDDDVDMIMRKLKELAFIIPLNISTLTL